MTPDDSKPTEARPGDAERALPQIDFSTLVLSLATSAMVHMGLVPDPEGGAIPEIIVSGGIRFDRRDASGFQEVEDVSPITGQKIRTTRFVEQEQFTYELDILFLDGHTGALRLRDRLSRGALFRGQANDPITAFYQLSEAVAGDVLAVVAPRTREELRILFRG